MQKIWKKKSGKFKKLTGKAGYTLVEMLVVIGIISVVVGLASFSFFRYADSSRVEGAAKNISGLIRGARQAAITNKAARRVVIELHPQWPGDPDKNDYIWVERPVYNPQKRITVWEDSSKREQMDKFVDISDFVVQEVGQSSTSNGNLTVDDISPKFSIFDGKVYIEFDSQGRIDSTYLQRQSTQNTKEEFSDGYFFIHVVNEKERITLSADSEGRPTNQEPYDPKSNYAMFENQNLVSGVDPYSERRKCYTIVVLPTIGRTRVLDYGYGSPWASKNPTFPAEL